MGNRIGVNRERSRRSRSDLGVSGLDPNVKLRLTDRDYQLMAFLYDQKFASLLVIYYRFFDQRKSGADPLPKNLWVTRQRLAILRQAGLISSQRIFTDARAVYLLTGLGFQVLRDQRGMELPISPAIEVEFRTFEHDKRVTMCRVVLEKQGKCLAWYPDRHLRATRGYPGAVRAFKEVPLQVIPDGIFISSKNERVALEIEHTPKDRKRYQEKLDVYRRLFMGIHSQDLDHRPVVERVHFVASSDRIGKDLNEFFYDPNRFRVHTYEELVGFLGKEALGI